MTNYVKLIPCHRRSNYYLILDELIVSATRMRRFIKIPLSVGPGTEKFNIVRNSHGCTQNCDFFVLDRKYPFRASLAQKSKLSAEAEIWY